MGRGLGQAVTFEDLRSMVTDSTLSELYPFTETERRLAKKSEIELRVNVEPITGNAGRAVKSEELISATPVPDMEFTVLAKMYYPKGTDVVDGSPPPDPGAAPGSYRKCRTFNRVGDFYTDLIMVPTWWTNNDNQQCAQLFVNDSAFTLKLRSTRYVNPAFLAPIVPEADNLLTTYNFNIGDTTKNFNTSLLGLYNCATFNSSDDTMLILDWSRYSNVVIGDLPVGYGTRIQGIKTINVPARYYFLGWQQEEVSGNWNTYITFRNASGTVIPAPINIDFTWIANSDLYYDDPANFLIITPTPISGSATILAGQTRVMIDSSPSILTILGNTLKTSTVTPGNIGSFKVVGL